MGRKALYLQFLWFWVALLHTGSTSVIVRLNGTDSSSMGRVEVQYRGVWGTICDDYWSIDNAHVICRMLGFARAFITKRFGSATGQIWLDDVSCEGTETSIDKCRHSGWGNHNCHHTEDVGVVCIDSTPNITVRMANSSLQHAAQIEIRYHGVWKPLCDGYWSLQDAHVVCRMFNYTDGAAFAVRGYQGTTSGDAWVTQISCSGTETSIGKCKIKHWSKTPYCSRDYRAGVVCLNKGEVSNVAVRLVDGKTPFQGRVEVRYHGVWGTICNYGWGISNAHVICHMLNYSKALTTSLASKAGNGPILLNNVVCSGFEDSIENCQYQELGQHFCYHGIDVEITCDYGPRAYPNISVRLVNGSFPYAGQIEMRYYGIWKPVCDGYYWTKADADVACRMLGYSQAARPIPGYQTTIGDAWQTRIGCSGTETSIEKCTHIYWKQSNCVYGNSAGVICLASGQDPNVAVRLVDGNTPNEGRIEVRYYGVWGTVCNNYWVINNAHVICRMLNYSKALWTGGAKVRGIGPIILGNVYCRGYENSIESCRIAVWGIHNCVHSKDVGVTCSNEAKAQSPDIAVRLVNGSSTHKGRVEIRYYGLWGTVCDDGWELADAHVVCRMLNYSKASWAGTAQIIGSGPIALDEVQCRGNEMSIEYCPKNRWGWHNCHHSEDAGVKCENLSKEELEVTVRLIGTTYKHMGIVEVNYNGTWRPVCDDTWDKLDAHVVCRMLGYKAPLLGIKGYRVGKATGLWMSNIECSGDEKLVSECYHRGWKKTRCPGERYAGVMCNATNDFPPVQVRLEDGSSPNSGRVAVRYGNIWGTICNSGLDINAAKVICRMLGYLGSLYTYNIKPGRSTIWLMNLECDGTENSIAECRHGWGNAATCSHYRSIAIMCKKADTPRFLIDGTNAIAESTAEILFKNRQPSMGTKLTIVYQIAVEKRNVENDFQSDGHTEPSAFTDGVHLTMEASKVNNSYIAAEILGSSSNLKIGDGQYYHGYYNAPLEPGCQYRVYVRAVTKTFEKKPIYSDTAFVAFTTKQQAIPNKADAPRFHINGTNAIAESTVEILFKNRQPLIGTQLTSDYQVAVEKRNVENDFQSDGHTVPSAFNEKVKETSETSKLNNSYITAEILANSSTLTIGDGQYYHGYYNAPLETGCQYRVYVRAVFKAVKKKPIYSDTAFVAFTTKQQAIPNKATSGTATSGTATSGTATPGTATYGTAKPGTATTGTATPGTAKPGTATSGTATPGTAKPGTAKPGTATSGTATSGTATSGTATPGTATSRINASAMQVRNSYKAELIGLSVILCILILTGIGYYAWCYLRKKRVIQENENTDHSVNESSNPHYQTLSHPATRGENNPSTPQYQPLSRPTTRGENTPSTPHYQLLSHPGTRGENNPSAPHYQPLSHSATRGETNPSTPHYQPLSHSATRGETNPSTPHYQPLSHSATQGENNPSAPHYQPLSHSATRGETNPSSPQYQPLSHSVNQKQPREILKEMYRKKLPDTSSASVITERSEPSPSNSQILHFPSDISGIENQGFSSSDIRLQELGFRNQQI